jgi:hypothetical protein
MMKTLRTLILATLFAALAAASPVYAQATLNATTLSSAIDAAQTTITVASATNVAVNNVLFVDREAMRVISLTGTQVRVTRGHNGTAARAHGAAAILYTGPATYYSANEVVPGSTCTSTAEVALPRIVLPTGNVYQCTNSIWYRVGSDVGAITVSCVALLIADMVDQSCFTADRDYVIVKITYVSKVVEAGGTLTIIPRRQQGTEAAASGDALATAISGVSTVAETVTAFTLTTTAADLILDAGDRLGLDFTDDAAGELAGVTVTFTLIPR